MTGHARRAKVTRELPSQRRFVTKNKSKLVYKLLIRLVGVVAIKTKLIQKLNRTKSTKSHKSGESDLSESQVVTPQKEGHERSRKWSQNEMILSAIKAQNQSFVKLNTINFCVSTDVSRTYATLEKSGHVTNYMIRMMRPEKRRGDDQIVQLMKDDIERIV